MIDDSLQPAGGHSCCAPAATPRPSVSPATRDAKGTVREDRLSAMVSLPGGPFLMGTDYAFGFPNDGEGPVRKVTLRPFHIDRHPVTNGSFAEFVTTTHYVTEAEFFGWSFVFWEHIPPTLREELIHSTLDGGPWWCRVDGACWRLPEGPGSTMDGRGDHPVVHVSWNDAQAYAAWAGLRLPTEAEWEYAARGGLEQKLYPWGDELLPGGEHRCNIWQGVFPEHDTAEDGFAGTCPVEAFPPNAYGLYSTTGNTWEWCSDWFSAHAALGPVDNPTGPVTGGARVLKGGSYLCHKSYCNRYRVAARTSNTPDSSTGHMGFRCAY